VSVVLGVRWWCRALGVGCWMLCASPVDADKMWMSASYVDDHLYPHTIPQYAQQSAYLPRSYPRVSTMALSRFMGGRRRPSHFCGRVGVRAFWGVSISRWRCVIRGRGDAMHAYAYEWRERGGGLDHVAQTTTKPKGGGVDRVQQRQRQKQKQRQRHKHKHKERRTGTSPLLNPSGELVASVSKSVLP
jgi:hypothetical protein